MKHKIIRFCMSSFSSFVVDYIIYSLMVLLLSDSAEMLLISNISARIISSVFNYCLNRRFVFNAEKSTRSAASYFLLALFILVMNNIVLEVLTQSFNINAFAAKILTECILFILSWIVQSRLIFRRIKEVKRDE